MARSAVGLPAILFIAVWVFARCECSDERSRYDRSHCRFELLTQRENLFVHLPHLRRQFAVVVEHLAQLYDEEVELSRHHVREVAYLLHILLFKERKDCQKAVHYFQEYRLHTPYPPMCSLGGVAGSFLSSGFVPSPVPGVAGVAVPVPFSLARIAAFCSVTLSFCS